MRTEVLLILACATWAPPALAQVGAADATALVAITQDLLHAVTRGDTATWARHLSPEWFIIDEEGRRHSRNEFLRQLRGLPDGQSGTLTLAKPHLVGGPRVAVLSYDIDEAHDFHGQQLSTRFHTTDTWVREGDGWKLLASQVTALPTPREGRRLSARRLHEYAGTYTVAPEVSLRIAADSSGLMLVRGDRRERLHALDDRIFIRHGARGYWLFERDESGDVAQVVHWRDNNPVVWKRLVEPGLRSD